MRLKTYLPLVAALLSAPHVLASEIPTPTPSTGSRLDDLIPSITPFPSASHGNPPNLELRQNLGVDPNPVAPPANQQVPPVTVYSIVSEIGGVGVPKVLTYTQLFVRVPDQFPLARPGQIGMGTLNKRQAVPAQTPIVNTEYVAQPLVLAMETVMITQPVRRVTDILVAETTTVIVGSQTAVNGTVVNGTVLLQSGTAAPLYGTRPASLGTGILRPLGTASGLAPSHGIGM